MEEDPLSLAALHDKQRRPLLIKTAAFAIHKSRDRLQLRSSRRRAARQRPGKR
jgi:hypothetical protein